MGDTWPYGSPSVASFDDTINAAHGAGFSIDGARVMAAIATAESGRDTMVVNDTPSTGDYSIGAWQINYYGSLRPGRVKAFGRPGHLARSGIDGQARAAYVIWQEQGLDAWSTYKSGAYLKYLHGGPGGIGSPQTGTQNIPPPTNAGADSWSGQVNRTSGNLERAHLALYSASAFIERLRR